MQIVLKLHKAQAKPGQEQERGTYLMHYSLQVFCFFY